MKKLLNTLYVTSPNKYLALDGENVVVLESNEEVGRIPLHNIQGIVTFGYIGASPALMGACASRDISLCFLSSSGRFLARIVGSETGNVVLRKTQYRISDDEKMCTVIAKNMIIGKIFNSRWVIERALRDHALRLDVEKLKRKSAFLKDAILKVKLCTDTQQLRGIEGEASSIYFSVFDDLVLQQKEDFYFKNRNKRPPLDNLNALLSFSYTLLANECASALQTVGLDPYVGFLHKDRPGRMSLALDLMEELRSVFADRFVLSLVNKKIVSPNGFSVKENGAVIMNDETRKIVLSNWQAKKKEVITHPFLQEKVEWGIVPHVQALLLARYIRGDIDQYPPFLWK
ncbi:type I-C CRISPR-associated endonuclease Cas1c [Thermoclostridium caenicola]|uniref:CRISPR-associated endonuclease Cas1 n=1 Tax=Thermoclostridium caenicola TaxID=659425 RepID=A0A1M6EJF3_9FIRM|nr:type I-C CRISPR-associated endonuclease Cas1c [Thermoclostridium caenicola]SHI85428.1 CRISPR-associated protein, Cas1 family [Thermoclostridium caenicola]